MESSKKPSSSSSSPDSTLEDPSKGDAKEHKKSASATSLPEVDQTPSQSPELSSDKVSTTESPPTQVMDRSGESSYRIPSSVFERTPSAAPAEWSTASNESLFSIHTGNMSFTKDNGFWRSGELGLPGEPSTSGQMFSYSGPLSPGGPATDLAKSGELAVETMKEVLRENAQLQSNGNNQPDERITHQDSGHGSTKSFAFPILEGDAEKVHSATINGSVKAAAPGQAPSPEPEKPKPKPRMQPRPQAESAAKAEPPAKEEPPAQKPKATRTKWFSCFSRCRFCC